MHEVLVNRLGGLSLPRKNVVRLTDRPGMTLDVYGGRKTTNQQQQQIMVPKVFEPLKFCCSYTTVCPPVRDNRRASEKGLSPVKKGQYLG